MFKLIQASYFFLLICLITQSCSNEKKDSSPEKNSDLSSSPTIFDNGNIQDSISLILKNTNFINSTYENSARANALSQQIAINPTNMGIHFNFAKETLNKGNTQEAIDHIMQLMDKYPVLSQISNETLIFHKFLGISYLRIAEQKNCQENHTDESCIIPITGTGLHKYKTGSQLAIEKYKQILEKFPEDYQSMWLYNVAHMTLGTYPQKVPAKWRVAIGEKSIKDIYKNVGSFTGVDDFDLSGGVITDDFNNDGLLDILVSSWGFNGKLVLYINRGAHGFMDMTEQSGLNDIKGGLNLKQADFNNDGHLDFFIMRGAWRPRSDWGILPNSLIMNNGDGSFKDVTIEKNVYSTRPTQSAEWFDFNNDGWLDLFVANETTNAQNEVFPCELYENVQGQSFKEVSKSYGIDALGYFKGCTSGDMNNDGLMDLYISNLNGNNHLYLNKGLQNGKWQFTDIAAKAGVTKPKAAFPCWFVDMNNDGFEDIYNFAYDPKVFQDLSGEFTKAILGKKVTLEASKIYLNQGDETFKSLSEFAFPYKALGTMGCNYGDVDNDGFIDFFLGTGTPDYRSVIPNRFFKNKDGRGYEDLTFKYGLGHIQKGHGIAFADLNNDGFQDIYAVMGGAFEGDRFPNALFNNPGNENDWIKLKLRGIESNRSAVGALIHIKLKQDGQSKSIYKRVNAGSSFGANPFLAHIGIGNNSQIQDISIKWPNGKNVFISYGKLNKNQLYEISEDGTIESNTAEAFTWQAANADQSHQH